MAEENAPQEPRGWHSRGYLPHFDGGSILQSVTYGLADSYPTRMLEIWREELGYLEGKEAAREERRRLMEYLDAGHGACWMARPEVAALVEQTLLNDQGARCEWHAWVIMPNHVHLLFRQMPGVDLGELVKDWKSITARRANALLGRKGKFWREDYFDRFIRDEEHYRNMIRYIDRNPVKAGLVSSPEEYRWCSAWWRKSD